MAADHLHFLKDKVMSDFEEAVEKFGADLPLRREFQGILKVLKEKPIRPTTRIEMKDSLYDLRMLLEECVIIAEKDRYRKTQNKRGSFNIYTVKKLWNLLFIRRIDLPRIKRKFQDVSDVAAAETFLPPESITVSRVVDLPPLNAPEIYGLDVQLRKLKSLLLGTPDDDDNDDNVKAIGVVGLPGVGKTTLARMVVVDDEVCRNFSPKIWVRLSGKPTLPKIVRHLLEMLYDMYQLNYDPPVTGDISVQLRELHNLLSNKKYLIVLDNVCDPNCLYNDLASDPRTHGTRPSGSLSQGLPKGCGGAIMVTSSIQDMGTSMVSESNVLRLEPKLDPKELWSIFMDSIKRKKFKELWSNDHQISPEILSMEDDIIHVSGGLPLAAKSLAEVISIQIGKEEYWSDLDARKEFCLRFSHLDWNTIEEVRSLQGVRHITASAGPGDDEITFDGQCRPVEIAREVGNFFHTELVSVKLLENQIA